MWYVVLLFKDDIFRSDFMRSCMQFQHHNITSDKLSDQNNEKFYHVKRNERHFFHYTEHTYHCIIMHIIKKQKQKQSIIKTQHKFDIICNVD
jgi:hypothetical protein